MNGAERFTFLDRIADFLVQDEADRGVDQVFFLFAAAAQHQAGNSHLLALDGLNEPAGWTENRRPMLRLRQAPGIVNSSSGRRPVARRSRETS